MAEDEMLDYRGAAAFLGIKVNTLYSLVSRGEIPHARFGRRLVRFSRAALVEWVKERTVAVRTPGP